MVSPRKNPFKPGAGRFPPERVGHDEAATYLADRLEDIRDKDGGDMVVLYGPRGNGKTALLGELCEEAKGGDTDVIEIDTSDMVGGSLADVLAAETVGAEREIKEAEIGFMQVRGRMALKKAPTPTGGNALRKRLNKPLLLVIDEAHEMPLDFGRSLLLPAQRCIKQGLPLLVVLAGTPGLPAHLGEMRVSFRERCTRLRIGRLETDEAVREALAKPAKDSGMPIDADALEKLVEESLRYPFFVQKLGFESWNAAHTRGGTRRITLKDAQRGVAIMEESLQEFYDERRIEIGKRNVLAEAEAVSKVVFDRGRDPRLTTSELMAAVEGAAAPNGRNPSESLRHLDHLGLVWKTPGLDWEPGIPSLCRFLVKREGLPPV